jgi:hypothetical protein
MNSLRRVSILNNWGQRSLQDGLRCILKGLNLPSGFFNDPIVLLIVLKTLSSHKISEHLPKH